MRLMATYKLCSGMRLAQPIYAQDGRILLQGNVVLTEGYIRRLQNMGYSFVYIDDAETCDIHVTETIPIEVRQEIMFNIKATFDKMSTVENINQFINSGVLGETFSKLYKQLFSYLRDNKIFVLHMSSIFSSDAFLYSHCMNVGVYASILGMAYGYSDEKMQQLGVGAMLHDIGKLAISKAILDKPGQLTPEERVEVEKHCWYGYDILTRQDDLSAVSAHCALQHHEQFDGQGYPRGLSGYQIHEVGRLLAVADVYDALTSNRVYRKAFLPHEAVEFLYSHTNTHFDKTFVDIFMKHINIYPVGLSVALSNGGEGVVARSNSGNFQRPVVLVTDEQGHSVNPYEIDLSTTLNVTITKCDSANPQSQVS